jgi:hypothetical protein
LCHEVEFERPETLFMAASCLLPHGNFAIPRLIKG